MRKITHSTRRPPAGFALSRYPLYEKPLPIHYPSLPLLGHGKVRDNYAVGDDKILIVTTDRLSAFDVVMNEPIPGKGMVLNQMSDFWFEKLGHIVPNHLTGVAPESVVAPEEVEQVKGRAVVAKRLKPIMVEAVVRGYIIGSGWKDYQANGPSAASSCRPACARPTSCRSRCSPRPPRPTWASMTKTSALPKWKPHRRRTGRQDARHQHQAVHRRRRIRGHARHHHRRHQVRIRPRRQRRLHLMDEVLTADSSRFWPADSYAPGMSPPSFDKQFVRDYLETLT
jgi:phosphoribosylaminoimidazole-succinocarboxamide synthase